MAVTPQPMPEEQVPGDAGTIVPPKVDAEPIVDPTTAFFSAPGFTTPGVVSPEDDMPDDIRALFDSEGLFDKQYSCMLKELPGGMDDGNDFYLASFRRTYPTIEYLTNNYGPGTYKLVFHWRGIEDETGKQKQKSDTHIMRVSEKTRHIFKEFQRQQKITQLKQQREDVHNARLEKELEDDLSGVQGADGDSKQSAKEYLRELVDTTRELGLSKNSSIDWAEILKGLAPLALPLFTLMQNNRQAERDRADRQMQMLITMMTGNNNQMLELAKAQSGQGSGTEIMKEMTSMIMSSLDLKGALEGQKETVADKIFSMIESVAPTLLQVASQPRAMQQVNPMVGATRQFMQSDPAFQQMNSDPEVLAEVVRKCDAHFGWEQTDSILLVSEKTRPENCPRMAGQQYPVDDPRNAQNVANEQRQASASDAEYTAVDDSASPMPEQ